MTSLELFEAEAAIVESFLSEGDAEEELGEMGRETKELEARNR